MRQKIILILVSIAIIVCNFVTVSADDSNNKEVAVEWGEQYCTPGLCSSSCTYDSDEGWLYGFDAVYSAYYSANDFYNYLYSDGWTKRFRNGDHNGYVYGNHYAYEKDFKASSGSSNNVEDVDFAYFCGHGKPTGFYFNTIMGCYNGLQDDMKLRYTDTSWGYRDLEWLTIDSCEVLKYSDNHGSVFSRWGWGTFNGLHQIHGWDSVAPQGSTRGKKFAQKMISGMTIKNAWLEACDETASSGYKAAVLSVCGPISTENDHLPGHGSVAGDSSSPNCLLWSPKNT